MADATKPKDGGGPGESVRVATAGVPPAWADGAVDLASLRLGSQAMRCSDDSFAPMHRMLAEGPALFRPGHYDEFGKWMDGWQTRRRRDDGHDWCVIRLGAAGRVRGVDVDTSHFNGDHPAAASLWAANTLDALSDQSGDEWTEIVPTTPLGPSAHHFLKVADPGPWRWLRLNIFPDGGVARLRVYGDVAPQWEPGAPNLELSAVKFGGRIVGFNDAQFGDAWAVLSEGRPLNMGDGWETRRRRSPGHDWLIVALGAPGRVSRVEVDTTHFKGNHPEACSVQGVLLANDGFDDAEPPLERAPRERGPMGRYRRRDGGLAGVSAGQAIGWGSLNWPTLVERTPLKPDARHAFEGAGLVDVGPVSHVRLNIFPDGGVSRFRVFGAREG